MPNREKKTKTGTKSKLTKGNISGIPPVFLDRGEYFLFVGFTYFFWFFFVFVVFCFKLQFNVSADTLREMSSASIAMAAIPFAILSILGAINREDDNYFKVALAATAIVFLLVSLGGFSILWTIGDQVLFHEVVLIKIVLGFLLAGSIQLPWSLAKYDQNNNKGGFRARALIDVSMFVVSFLVIQFSSVKSAEGNFLPFVIVGFAGGAIALIVLIFSVLFSIFSDEIRGRPFQLLPRNGVPLFFLGLVLIFVLFVPIALLCPCGSYSTQTPLPTALPTMVFSPIPSPTATLTAPSTPSPRPMPTGTSSTTPFPTLSTISPTP